VGGSELHFGQVACAESNFNNKWEFKIADFPKHEFDLRPQAKWTEWRMLFLDVGEMNLELDKVRLLARCDLPLRLVNATNPRKYAFVHWLVVPCHCM
jgi:hypothetical protein